MKKWLYVALPALVILSFFSGVYVSTNTIQPAEILDGVGVDIRIINVLLLFCLIFLFHSVSNLILAFDKEWVTVVEIKFEETHQLKLICLPCSWIFVLKLCEQITIFALQQVLTNVVWDLNGVLAADRLSLLGRLRLSLSCSFVTFFLVCFFHKSLLELLIILVHDPKFLCKIFIPLLVILSWWLLVSCIIFVLGVSLGWLFKLPLILLEKPCYNLTHKWIKLWP